jgi:hypothetical protein
VDRTNLSGQRGVDQAVRDNEGGSRERYRPSAPFHVEYDVLAGQVVLLLLQPDSSPTRGVWPLDVCPAARRGCDEEELR